MQFWPIEGGLTLVGVAEATPPALHVSFREASVILSRNDHWKLTTDNWKLSLVLRTSQSEHSAIRAAAAAVLTCALMAADPVPPSEALGAADRQTAPSSRPAPAGESREALQRAAHLVQQGRLEEAEAHAQLALSNPETRGAAHSVLGAIRFQQERLDESARLLHEAIRLEPRLIGAHLTLAEVHIAQGQVDLATPLFRRVLELDPMNSTARFGLARAEAEKGNFQASLDIARPVIEAFKLFPEGLFLLATNFLKTGDRQ